MCEPGKLSYWKDATHAKSIKRPNSFVISRTSAGGQASYELFVSANNAADMNDWMKFVSDSKKL